jgi:orotate phosphoribosyltransferase
MNHKEWTRFLLDNRVLKFGDFTLKDGSSSPFFLDFGALAGGKAFREVGDFFRSRIEETVGFDGVDFLYGPPYKAVVLAAATAMRIEDRDLGLLFTRKEEKKHGEGGKSFGHEPSPGERYLLLDDVMSSGGTKVEALNSLPDLTCQAVVVGVDRQHRHEGKTAAERFTEETGVPVVSLITLEGLVEAAQGLVGEREFAALQEFCCK